MRTLPTQGHQVVSNEVALSPTSLRPPDTSVAIVREGGAGTGEGHSAGQDSNRAVSAVRHETERSQAARGRAGRRSEWGSWS